MEEHRREVVFRLCGWGFITRTAFRFRLYETQYSNPTRVLGKYEDILSDAIQIPGTILVSACPGSGYIVCGAVDDKARTRCVTSQPRKLLVHNAARLATSVDQETASPCECKFRHRYEAVYGLHVVLSCSAAAGTVKSIQNKPGRCRPQFIRHERAHEAEHLHVESNA